MADLPASVALPSSWRKRVHPRRGFPSAGFAKVKLDKKASTKLLTHLETLRGGLSISCKGGKKISAAIDSLPGATDDSEIAAAICALAYYRVDYDAKPQPVAAVDHFAHTSGLPFAVDAALHSISLNVGLKKKKVWSPTAKFVLREKNEASAKSFDAPQFFHMANDVRPALFRLRTLLAVCDESEYAAALALAKAHRKKDASLAGCVRRIAVSYLFEGERELVTKDIRAFRSAVKKHTGSAARAWLSYHTSLILASLRTLGEYETLNGLSGPWPERPWDLVISAQHEKFAGKRWHFMPTLLEGLGEEVLPLCLYLYDDSQSADYISPVAFLQSDEALTALMDRAHEKHAMAALSDAAASSPKRALRLLTERVKAKGNNHKKLRPLIAVAKAAKPAPKAGGKIPSKTGTKRKKKPNKVASMSGAPRLLADPPWNDRTKTKFKPMALEPIPYDATFAWAEGEKEEYWLQRWNPGSLEHSERFPFPGGYLERLQQGGHAPKGHWKTWTEKQWLSLNSDWECKFRVALGPEHLSWDDAQQHVSHPKYFYKMGTAITRHGDRLLPLLIEQAKRHPKEAWVHLGPFDCAELAAPLASVLHVKKIKADLERWFIRHPRAAAAGLVPDLLGKDAKRRKAATLALKVVARRNAPVITEVAELYGAKVATLVNTILSDDPRFDKQPKAPSFWNRALPTPRLKSGGAIDDVAFDHLRTFLMLSELDDPLPGLHEVLEAFDEESLASFGIALFEAWARAGYPREEKWVMSVQGFVGNDETVRMLAPLVRKWPGESSHVRATHGLQALAAIGSDLALMGIHDIGQRLKFKALKEMAGAMVKGIAQDRGLCEEELADRLVPTFGLGPSGALPLDFGARSFEVRFDEALKVELRDDKGKKLKSLPKPNKSDDAAKAKEAKKTLSSLKKDVKTIAASQLARLEKSMSHARRWRAENFERFFARHPLMRHLAQRLVWATYDDDGHVLQTFRLTEDGTYASSNDEAFTLRAGDSVGILHPVDAKSADLAAWGSIFADYEILQPFPQLIRAVYNTNAALALFDKLKNTTVPTTIVLQLAKADWSRGEPQESGHIFEMTRPLGDRQLRLELNPGFNVTAVGDEPEQTLQGLFIGTQAITKSRLSSFSPIDQSELAWSLRTLV